MLHNKASTDKNAIRPFQMTFPDDELTDLRRRIEATRWPDRETDASQGVSARDDAGTRALLGDRVRLAQGRGEAERPAAVHHRDRRGRHSFHSRSFEARRCVAAHRLARMARLGHRAAEDHRSPDQSHGPRRHGIGRFRCGDPEHAGLRVFRQADHDRLGTRAYRTCLDRADEAPRIHALCRARRRLGWGCG